MDRQSIRERLIRVTQRLDAYYAAELAILSGAQEYSIGSRSLRRGDLDTIRKEIEALEKQKDELETALATCSSPNKRKTVRVLFRDL